MNYYTADLHLNSVRNVEFRPFTDVNEMNSIICENIARRVSKYDTLYILGDVGSCSNIPYKILRALKCTKILIVGNNDIIPLKNNDKAGKKFKECFYRIYYGNYTTYDDGIWNNICMCHYPMASWNGSRSGVPLFYGHIHTRTDDGYGPMMLVPNAFNVGVDATGYMPVTAREVIGLDPIPKREDIGLSRHDRINEYMEKIKPYNFMYPHACRTVIP